MKQEQVDEFVEFATNRSGQLYRSACLLAGGDVHLAEDLVQETLGRVYLNWRRVSAADNPVAYAHTVLARTFISHKRRRSSGEQPTGYVAEAAVRESDSATRIALLEALGRLAYRDRAVLVLRYWEDRSVEETGAILRMTAGVVRAACSRALTRLRGVLGTSLGDFAQH